MASPINTDAAALRKKRAEYMRGWNQRRGAIPVKGTTFICEGCSQSFSKTDVKQIRCAQCRVFYRLEHNRLRRLRVGHEPIGSPKKCKNCATEFTKAFKRHFYCEPCSKLSELEYLPHQIENTRRRAAKFQRERRQRDPKWNIASRMSAGISNSLRDGKNGRSWESLVGYTVIDLMNHLERQFVSSMSWDNRAKWHIDHIRPLSSFEFATTDDSDFMRAWAISNLQPLWARDNIRKSAKLTEPIMIKMKALRSFGVANSNEGKVKRGREFDAASEHRAKDLESHGLAYRIEDYVQPQPIPLHEVTPENKAAEVGPLSLVGGETGAEIAPSLSDRGRPPRTRALRKPKAEFDL